MEILRAKTVDLFHYTGLSKLQLENSGKNQEEMILGALQLESYPQRLVLELTNACNLNCIMCGRDRHKFTARFFEFEYLNTLIPILEYVKEITLFGWGEPTIHPKFQEFLELFSKYPVKKYFVTNGTTLGKIKDYLFDCKVDIVAVSIDGATAETSNKIRRKSDFDQIVSNLKAIVQQRKSGNVPYPYINFVVTLMSSNLHELPNIVNLAHDIGIEEVKGVYLTAFSKELEKEVLWNRADEVREVFEETLKRGKELGLKIKLPYVQGEDIAGDRLHKDCFVGWRDFFIGSDGYVRPCQSVARKLFHISKYNNFMDAWNSVELVEFRSAVNNAERMWKECRRCYQSSHANSNKRDVFFQVGSAFAPEWG